MAKSAYHASTLGILISLIFNASFARIKWSITYWPKNVNHVHNKTHILMGKNALYVPMKMYGIQKLKDVNSVMMITILIMKQERVNNVCLDGSMTKTPKNAFK